MSENFSFNINGTKFTVKEGVNIKTLGDGPAKSLLSIFDTNKDSILSKTELEEVKKHTFVYGERGYEITRTKDYNGAEIIRVYGERGYEIKRTRDTDGDGKTDEITTIERGEKGNVTKITSDYYYNGDVKAEIICEFDEKGHRVKVKRDYDRDFKAYLRRERRLKKQTMQAK